MGAPKRSWANLGAACGARLELLTLCLGLVLCSCGGSQNSSQPPAPDFSLSLSPIFASAVIGNATSPISVSAVPQNFNGTINVTFQGLRQGVDITSGFSFSLKPGISLFFMFSVSVSAPVGEFPITLAANSGVLTHSVQLVLTTEPLVSVRTYQSGSLLLIESDSSPGIARVGLETTWGGSIVEVSLVGTNFVNRSDTGREVQAAQYDGNAQYDACAGCTGIFGWNPVQGGDKYSHGSPLLA